MKYLSPCIAELKYKDFLVYKAYQASIRRRLFRQYGLSACLLCSNRTTILFALMTDSLAGRQSSMHMVRGFWPFRRHREMSQTRGIILAARMWVLIQWYSLMEWTVRQNWSLMWLMGKLGQAVLRPVFETTAEEAPILNRVFRQDWDYAQALRTTRCSDYKEGSKPLVQLMGAMAATCADDDIQRHPLQMLGQHLGYMLFLMTSVSQYRNDARWGRHNVYLEREMTEKQAAENAKRQCLLTAAKMAQSYHNLQFILHKGLIDNIIIDGTEQAIQYIGRENDLKETEEFL